MGCGGPLPIQRTLPADCLFSLVHVHSHSQEEKVFRPRPRGVQHESAKRKAEDSPESASASASAPKERKVYPMRLVVENRGEWAQRIKKHLWQCELCGIWTEVEFLTCFHSQVHCDRCLDEFSHTESDTE